MPRCRSHPMRSHRSSSSRSAALPIAPRQQCRGSLPKLGARDSGTAHERRPFASQHTVLARTQQGGVAAYEVKLPRCRRWS